jgi:hypothetical protein
MGLLDDIAGGLKKGLDYAKEKGELGAKIAQLRLELVNLTRERDGLYGRLGKMYFTNRDDTVRLEPIITELQRVLGEVRKREEALDKLGEKPEETPVVSSDPVHSGSSDPAHAASSATVSSVPHVASVHPADPASPTTSSQATTGHTTPGVPDDHKPNS